ncbi:MAG: 3-dehydroquinate synthase [Anaerolineae bacterium]
MTGRRNIVLTGFMGTGKTAVGKLVAERLARQFVDMDDVLAQRFGMSISDVFRRLGEPFFRQHEAALCRELARAEGLVIATGGGALVDRANRCALGATGILICLRAGADVLWQRVGLAQDRPMLAVPDRRSRLEALLCSREPAYDEIPHHVDTSSLSVEQAAEQVIKIAGNAERVQERNLGAHYPGGFYPIFITHGGLKAAGLYLRSRGLSGAVAIVTDETVGAIAGDHIWQGLSQYGFRPALFVFPTGEQNKTLATVESLIGRLVEAGLSRDTTVVALGGGVVGDTAGLVSALYMRGISLVQVPTTLLAMVDSSVGGKVAVDLPAGKNLVGAFKQPKLVLADVAVLDSLPVEEKRAGLAEVVKAGIIADPDLFAAFEQGSYELADVVERALRVKIELVEADPYEQGQRALLNLGHTFAHAYETLSNYTLRHGDAVAVGMVLACRLSALRGLCSEELPKRVVACLRRLGLPTEPPVIAPEAVVAAMQKDKKKRAGHMRFVLPVAIGDVRVFDDVTEEQLLLLGRREQIEVASR